MAKNDREYTEEELKFILENALTERAKINKNANRDELLKLADELGIDTSDLDSAERKLYQTKEEVLRKQFRGQETNISLRTLLVDGSLWFWFIVGIVVFIIVYGLFNVILIPVFSLQDSAFSIYLISFVLIFGLFLLFMYFDYRDHYNRESYWSYDKKTMAVKRLFAKDVNEEGYDKWLKEKDYSIWLQYREIKKTEKEEADHRRDEEYRRGYY